jgi:hypothetical protein
MIAHLGDVGNSLYKIFLRLCRIFDARLNRYCFDRYSQNGEDGVIEEIFRRIGTIDEEWMVEFGAWDGIHLSNTYYFIEKYDKFKAVLIEAESERFCDLQRTASRFNGRMVPIRSFIQPGGDSSLTAILGTTGLPRDFLMLSIDVDGMDYHIWESFHNYEPKVVVIEINSSIPADIEYLHGQGDRTGSSFLSTLKLGASKGYSCVCHTGNMIFLRNDFLPKIGLSKRYIENPQKLFLPFWINK